jgi:hypothetical protein
MNFHKEYTCKCFRSPLSGDVLSPENFPKDFKILPTPTNP